MDLRKASVESFHALFDVGMAPTTETVLARVDFSNTLSSRKCISAENFYTGEIILDNEFRGKNAENTKKCDEKSK
jgi:hypothetical protein